MVQAVKTNTTRSPKIEYLLQNLPTALHVSRSFSNTSRWSLQTVQNLVRLLEHVVFSADVEAVD